MTDCRNIHTEITQICIFKPWLALLDWSVKRFLIEVPEGLFTTVTKFHWISDSDVCEFTALMPSLQWNKLSVHLCSPSASVRFVLSGSLSTFFIQQHALVTEYYLTVTEQEDDTRVFAWHFQRAKVNWRCAFYFSFLAFCESEEWDILYQQMWLKKSECSS